MLNNQPEDVSGPSGNPPDESHLLAILTNLQRITNTHGWAVMQVSSMTENHAVRQLSDRGWVEISESEVRFDLLGDVKAGSLICAITELGLKQLERSAR